MIYCASGWVDVVYEDQGDAFRLAAGDCVLQPPGIRHRVLRASPDIEVIELSCPAVHDTISDHDLELPTGVVRPERAFGGQRFVRHVAAAAPTAPWLVPGLDARDTGIGAATGGLAGAVVVTATDPATVDAGWLTHDDELVFDAVLGGAAELALRSAAGERTESLVAGDAVALPPGTEWRWSAWSDDVELLEVAVGAGAVRPSS
jgi:quercetin dioxygenase-like cupin family protein